MTELDFDATAAERIDELVTDEEFLPEGDEEVLTGGTTSEEYEGDVTAQNNTDDSYYERLAKDDLDAIRREFFEAKEGYKCVISKIKPSDILPLEKFLEEKKERELNKRREAYLRSLGYTTDILTEGYQPRSKGERRARKRAMAIRQRAMRTGMLLERDAAPGTSDLYHPTVKKLLRIIMKLLPTSACMVFTASVMLNAKGELTAGVVIESILRLSTLPIVGFRGYAFGYRYSKNTRAFGIREKTRILEAFLAQGDVA